MIAVLTDPACGGTFLTWSLYYLTGQTEYYSVTQQQKTSLISDPVTVNNAHGFRPNQPNMSAHFIDQVDALSNRPAEEFNVVYFHNFGDCNQQPGGPTSVAIDTTIKHFEKRVYLGISPQNSLYQFAYDKRVLSPNPQTGKPFSSQQEQYQNFIETYFEQSRKIWQEHGLTQVWDQREFLALNCRPNDIVRISDVHGFDFDHFYIDSMDLWTQFDSTVLKLFEYLELDIDPGRWDQWLEVYNKWKKIHYQRIRFVMYFDTIIQYILQGNSMDLESFDLDIMQESAIQHTLIYNHNLNLKTWQLNKFLNTQQLHSLLETNTHSLH
jgi:hypothetical protein